MNDAIQNLGESPSDTRRFAVIETLRHYASLSNLLRALGAGVVVASVSMFLFKGWSDSNDIQRYLMLLAHTIALATTGVVIGHWVGESKGARLFLSLSLVSTVVNFAVLAGLVYSQFQWDGGLTQYPQFARWQAGSAGDALLTAGVGMALLAPVAWLSFMALARRSASSLTGLFLLSGVALLLPVRETAYVAVLCGALVLGLLFTTARAKRRDPVLGAAEGRFARLVPFLIPVVMVGRGMFLYGAGFMMFTTLFGLAFLVLRHLSLEPGRGHRSRILLDRLAAVPALFAALGTAGLLLDNELIGETTWIPVAVVIAGALLTEISMRTPTGGAGHRRLAALLACSGLAANLWWNPETHTALICSAIGLLVTVLGFSEKQRLVLAAGLATFLVGVVYQCAAAFSMFDLGSWSALAIIGVVAIVSGSVLERHGAVIKARLGNWRNSLQHWEN